MTVHAPRKKPKRMGRLAKIKRLTLQERLDFINERSAESGSSDPSVWTKRYRKVRKRALAAGERRRKNEDPLSDEKQKRWKEKNKGRIQAAKERVGR